MFWRTRRSTKTAALRAGEQARKLAALAVRPVIALPEGDEPPAEFRIFSVGVNETEKGPFLWDAIAAATCMAFYENKKVDLSMDWEHQALSEPPVQAPASAWWTPEIRDGELWATNVRWTPDAATQIRKKEYRYFSPAFTFDDASRPDRIINVALTNIPAMDRIAPLVAANATAADHSKENENMDEINALKAEISDLKGKLSAKDGEVADLRAKLSGMSDEGKETCRVAGLRFDAPHAELRSTISALSATTAKLRELTGESTDQGALARLSVMKDDATEVVKLRATIAENEEKALTAELRSTFEQGEKDMKVPRSEDHPTRKSLTSAVLAHGGGKITAGGIAWLKAEIASRPKLGATSESVPRAGVGVGLLTEQQERIARMAGGEPAVEARRKFAEKEAARGGA